MSQFKAGIEFSVTHGTGQRIFKVRRYADSNDQGLIMIMTITASVMRIVDHDDDGGDKDEDGGLSL